MKTGLVSVTFRQLSPEEIIALCQQAGIDGIEWGGDVHVTDVKTAKAVKQRMDGLEVLSFGSYYRLGQGADFAPILETAKALEAPNIRVWAGIRNPEEYTESERAAAVADARRIADLAADAGMDISFEYHGNTLTASQHSAMQLLNEIGKENVYLYWQPLGDRPQEEYLSEIGEIRKAGRLKNLHVYTWRGPDRYPLSADGEVWKERLAAADRVADAALIEFVKDDDPKQFLDDAAWLKAAVKK